MLGNGTEVEVLGSVLLYTYIKSHLNLLIMEQTRLSLYGTLTHEIFKYPKLNLK